MPAPPLREVLVATDLTPAADEVVRAAAGIADATGARLHAVHVMEGLVPAGEEPSQVVGFEERVAETGRRLDEQLRRVLPPGVSPASREVVIWTSHRAIHARAQEVGADLVVLGPHRGEGRETFYLGSTADRVIRTSEVPCLVVRRPLPLPLRRIGVPTDLSGPARGALEVALAWAGALGGGPGIHVFHVGWSVEAATDPRGEKEERLARLRREVEDAVGDTGGAGGTAVTTAVLWGNEEAEAIATHAGNQDLDLLVMGTHGYGAVRRTLVGSVASSVARRAPCSVLLVPPFLWKAAAARPRLERVLVAVDFRDPSTRGAEWTVRSFAPGAEHVFTHVVRPPEAAGHAGGGSPDQGELARQAREVAARRLDALAGSLAAERGRVAVEQGSPVERIIRLAEEQRADVIAIGEHGSDGGLREILGTTAERLLHRSPVPVLVGRRPGEQGVARILAAVDGSEMAERVLAWTHLLAGLHGAHTTLLTVVEPPIYGDYLGIAPGPVEADEVGEGRRKSTAEWLEGLAREAGLAPERTRAVASQGVPGEEIVEAARRDRADLVVVGSRGPGTAGRLFLGSVAGDVIRDAPCPVLVVVDPLRAAARE